MSLLKPTSLLKPQKFKCKFGCGFLLSFPAICFLHESIHSRTLSILSPLPIIPTVIFSGLTWFMSNGLKLTIPAFGQMCWSCPNCKEGSSMYLSFIIQKVNCQKVRYRLSNLLAVQQFFQVI